MTIILAMRNRLFALAQAFFALVAGFLIYWLFREGTLLHRLPLLPLKSVFSQVYFFGDGFVRFYLTDFLWGYAFASALYAVYPPIGTKKDLVPFLLTATVGVTYEVLQGESVLSGTGDVADGVLYLLAAFAAYKIILSKTKRRKTK